MNGLKGTLAGTAAGRSSQAIAVAAGRAVRLCGLPGNADPVQADEHHLQSVEDFRAAPELAQAERCHIAGGLLSHAARSRSALSLTHGSSASRTMKEYPHATDRPVPEPVGVPAD